MYPLFCLAWHSCIYSMVVEDEMADFSLLFNTLANLLPQGNRSCNTNNEPKVGRHDSPPKKIHIHGPEHRNFRSSSQSNHLRQYSNSWDSRVPRFELVIHRLICFGLCVVGGKRWGLKNKSIPTRPTGGETAALTDVQFNYLLQICYWIGYRAM